MWYPDYKYLRENNHVFTDIAASPNSINVTTNFDEHGEVKIADGSSVTMKDGQVSLTEPAQVQLDPNATVELDASALKTLLPKITNQPEKTPGGEAIKTEVTLFRTVPMGYTQVVTGIVFPSGRDGEKPTSQYCYVKHATGTVTEDVTYIAFNRQPTEKSTSGLLERCVWWKN